MKVKGQLKKAPQNVSFLAPKPNYSVPAPTLRLVFDDKTFNTECKSAVQEGYYDDYVMTTTFSETMQKLQAKQAATLRGYATNGGRMVEIGCGDGSFLKHCSNHFDKVVGIEPSKAFGDEARKAGFKVVRGYVTSEKPLIKGKFDAFASRQVFEHLKDPMDVLIGIKYMLKDGAVGLIEVPNGYRALRNGRFYEFFPDHVQYYSVNRLVELATKAGFNVISCNETFGGDYLELWVRWEPKATNYISKMAKTQAKVSKAVEEFIIQNRKVVVFGAGAKTISILTTLPYHIVNEIVFVIDDDPHKWNKYIANSKVPVVGSTEVSTSFEPDNVLILALSYIDEISAKVKKLYPNASVFALINNEITKL